MTTEERIRDLRARIFRLGAELNGLENGALVVLEERGEATCREIAEALGVSQASANNYAVALWRAEVVDRKRTVTVREDGRAGGRAFVYYLTLDHRVRLAELRDPPKHGPRR